jgi:16S rRNA processing protein RimM
MKAIPLSNRIYTLPTETEIVLHLSSGLTECRKLSSARKAGKYAILSIEGINSPERASEYRGADIEADKSLMPDLPETEYFHDQIIGLIVCTPDGTVIGKVSEIFETGSNDVYVVEGIEKEYLIPAIRDVILEVNLEGGKLIIQPIEGLLD